MTTQLEGNDTVHEFDGVSFESEAELCVSARNIDQYAGVLVLAIPYKDGRPTLISGPAYGEKNLENAANDTDGKFYVPTILGRLGKMHSDTHFTVVPLSHDTGNKSKPPRLFAFGEALIKAASKIET